MSTAIIILAAGGSSRLGKPKQLLIYKNKTLLEHIIAEATATTPGLVLIVLGAYAGELIKFIPENVDYVVNENWQDGMASSIFTGMTVVTKENKDVESIILTVADQPFADRKLFIEMIDIHKKTGKGIIASEYSGTTGTPALFTRKYFPALLALNGKEGAKKLFNRYKTDLETVTFEHGAIDIDTTADYNNLITFKGDD